MPIAADHLGDIYKQINEHFLDHPFISVAATQGDPPDQYTIRYNISGLSKSEDGEISEISNHVVELAIPFGFPHFPPRCWPTTPLFHPDFTPESISVGDFWRQHSSITELILKIGMMINGEHYSIEEPANEEAAGWYAEHSDKFPLSELNWDGSSRVPAAESQEGEEALNEAEDLDEVEELDFSILEEDDFTLDPDEDEPDLITAQTYQSAKEYLALQKMLDGPAELSVELQPLLADAKVAIKESTELYTKAKEFEKQGLSAEALKSYEDVAKLVSDYPAIQSDIKRLEQAQVTGDDTSPDTKSSESKKAAPLKQSRRRFSLPKRKPKKDTPAKVEEVVPARPRRLLLPLLIVLLLLSIGVFIASFYYQESEKIWVAQDKYEACNWSLRNKEYKQAKQYCDQGLRTLQEIRYFHKEKVAGLSTSMNTILQSKRLKVGLEDRILVDGKLLTRKEANLIKEFKSAVEVAEELYSQGRYKIASAAFKKAILVARKNGIQDQEAINTLELKDKLSTFKQAQAITIQHLLDGRWQLVIDTVPQAQQLLTALPAVDQKQYDDQLENALALSKFELAREEGDAAIARGAWDDAVSHYNRAMEYALETTAVETERIVDLENSIDRAGLYKTLEQGNMAFTKGQWDEAVKAFREANVVLSQSKFAIIDEHTSEINRKKLNKIILQASIIRDQQSIKTMLKNDELTSARKAYKNVLVLIDRSSLGDDTAFIQAKQDIAERIAELDERIYIIEKQRYLESNYQALFKENYPTVRTDSLTAPSIQLIENSDSSLLFRMQSAEKINGRSLALVMFYSYFRETDKWQLSAGTD